MLILMYTIKGQIRILQMWNRTEGFELVRWLNLAVGVLNIYYYVLGAGWPLMGIACLNVGVWAMTRQKVLVEK